HREHQDVAPTFVAILIQRRIHEGRRLLVQTPTFDVRNNPDNRAPEKTVFWSLCIWRQQVFWWSHPDGLADRILAREETFGECLADYRDRLRIALIVAVEGTAFLHRNAERAEVVVAD